MSSSAAIATVTYALTALIQKEVDSVRGVAGTKVTSVPPDKARTATTGNQVNVFLYRVSIDPAWRNMDAPGTRPGELSQPPLPLILSYLITAYGENEEEIPAHRLLGNAMSILNDSPILARADIARITAEMAAGSGLDQQVELVKFTPDPRPQDELSRMWTTFGTGYRLSVSYDASVVLIDSRTPLVAPMPVLARGPADSGPTVTTGYPRIDSAVPLVQLPSGEEVPNAWGAAQAGEKVRLTGTNLSAVTSVEMNGLRLDTPVLLTPTSNPDGSLVVVIPADRSIPAGIVSLSAVVDEPSGPLYSASVPLAVAPAITNASPIRKRLGANGSATIAITCEPQVVANQAVALIVGSTFVPTTSPATPTGELSFTVTGLAKKMDYPLRLRVDSVDSLPTATPPSMTGNPNVPDPISLSQLQPVLKTS
jgi:Pvc16 N-terminal domain